MKDSGRSESETIPAVDGELEDALLRNAGAEAALAALLESHEAASHAGVCRWQFAVEVQFLLAHGVSINLLRSLVRAHLAEHRQETSKPDDETRKFLPLMNLSLPERTCLVLTDAGLGFARESLPRLRAQHDRAISTPLSKRASRVRPAPAWDAQRRELRFGDRLVKAYRVPAANQERVLEAFQDAGWPECLDNPLPHASDQDAKRRLHQTIQKLNQSTRSGPLRFRGDGTGQRICWELRTSEATRRKVRAQGPLEMSADERPEPET